MNTDDQIRDALLEPVPEDTANAHLDRIRLEARIVHLENKINEHQWALMNHQEALDAIRESQKADESATIKHLRQLLKAIVLTEVLNERARWEYSGWANASSLEPAEWDVICDELYRRYGHLTMPDGTPLWSRPPTVSNETKALVADLLKRRQEA